MQFNQPTLTLIKTNKESVCLSDSHITIFKSITNVGKKDDNDIILKNKSVSGHHASIIIINDREQKNFLVKDNNSTNKTFINGIQITDGYLHDQDILKFGEVEFLFHSGEPNTKNLSTVVLNIEQKDKVEVKKLKNLDPFYFKNRQKEEKFRFISMTLMVVLGFVVLILIGFIYHILSVASKLQ